MLTVIFWLAVACGLAGALARNRTAYALLASIAVCLVMEHYAVPFNFVLWVLIDLVVVLVIIRPALSRTDVIVLALFIPAWVAYLLPEYPRFAISFSVVVAQLALTFPVEPLRRKLAGWAAPRRPGDFDKMVAHARLAGA